MRVSGMPVSGSKVAGRRLSAEAIRQRKAAAAREVERLEALSRLRALDDRESLLLERAIYDADGKRHPSGFTRLLARHGIKRDLDQYRR